MDEAFDTVDPERAWAALVAGIVAIVGLGWVLFPRRIYDGFIWRYFWGPVVADGRGAACAERVGGSTVLHATTVDCRSATGIVAEPGYTVVSTVSYAVILVVALAGVLLLLRRLDVGRERGFFYALFPFMLFGGTLRTVEDASLALPDGAALSIPFPWTALIISPFIYFTVFAIAIGALVVSVVAADRDLVERYEHPLAAIGTIALLSALAYLAVLAAWTDTLTLIPAVPVITLVGATLITAAVWIATLRYAPEVHRGTGYMGALIVWGHTVDGIANVLSLDWADHLGLPVQYGSKHVVNRAIVEITGTVQPPAVSQAIGTAWPFLFVKVGVAVAVVWIFDETIFEESPYYAMALLIAILAVGLGPGTRDMLRATFGI